MSPCKSVHVIEAWVSVQAPPTGRSFGAGCWVQYAVMASTR
jgi:hypothetical protein